MRAAATLLALVLAAGTAAADVPRPRSLDALLVVVQNAVLATGAATEVRIDPQSDTLLLTWKGTRLVADPHNLFMEMQRALTDAERQDLLDTYLASFDDLLALESGVLEPERLMPIIRPGSFAAHRPKDRAVVAEPWFAGLSIYLVEDGASSTAYVTPARLAGAGLDAAQAHQIALRNLAARKPGLEPLGPKRWGLVLDGTYESSLLLVSELWRRMAETHGPLIMVVPTREQVVLDASGDPSAIDDLAAFARETAQANPYPVSPFVFAWRAGRWEVLRGQ